MFKNQTPFQVALLASLVIIGFFTLGYLILIQIPLFQSKLFGLAVSSIGLFLICFFTIKFFLNRFIYRRIKLIYKSIHQFKRTKGEKFKLEDIDNNIIDEVEEEVEEWVEGQAREIQHLKTLEEYRKIYIGNVSHELKTPIFNIQGYVHTLLDGGLYDENINQSYLERAAKNAERLQIIIEDLDTISKLESGQLVLEVRAFDIKELSQSVFEELEILAREHEIELVFKEGADKPYLVNADMDSIRQVLVNLISNSIKYGKKGGTTKVSFYDMDKYILVEVADNGIGISPESLPHVFDRFYRADKSRSRALGGSGLGLSIVKHIIEGHQQTINVRSAPKLGSTFGFTLDKA